MTPLPLLRPFHRPASHRILVVGGGIAGIQAALDLAACGLPVTLVEEGPALGGLMAQLDKTFPTNDCAMCILSPRMLEIARHPLVEILTLTRLVDLAGEAGDFQALLSRRPRYVEEDKCSGCGECTRVCPKTIPDPYNLGLSATKAIHVPFPQAVPQAAYIDPEACRLFRGKPCEACLKVCAAGAINPAQTQEFLIRRVGAVILAAGARPAPVNGFPGAAHPDVVTGLQFERLLSATGPHSGRLLRPSDRTEPRNIAFIQCVGSRDLGSGAAYCSATCCMAALKEALVAKEISPAGLEATLFYMDLRAHGKGYEEYLERARLEGVRLIRSRVIRVEPQPEGGVLVHYADGQGRHYSLGFDLAVLSVGLRPGPHLSEWARRLGLKLNPHGFVASGPENPVLTARPGILVCGTAREPMDIPEAVATAGAAAQAAAQLLALSPRTWAPRPEFPLAAAEPEPRLGVFLCHCGTNIAATIDLEQLAEKVQKLPRVALVEKHLFLCSADSARQMREAIRRHRLNRVVVAACTPRTHEPVFREVVTAAGLNPGFLAFANIREQCAWVHQGDPAAALQAAQDIVAMAVRRAAVLRPLQVQRFSVIPKALVVGGGVAGLSAAVSLADLGFHTYVVEREARLGGLARRLCFTLEGHDPAKLVQELEAAALGHPNVEVLTRAELQKTEGHVGRFRSLVRRRTAMGHEDRQLEHGVILVATGGREFSPEGRYLYGSDPRVLTQLQLEEKIHAGDPGLEKARQVVMIQCVGSREPEHPYCSRLCCSEALKNAIRLMDRQPLLDVTVLYRDIRAYGFREDFYLQAKEKGVRFIPYGADRPPRVEVARRKALMVRVWDELLNQEVGLAADLVVLSAGIEPAAGSDRLARLLGIPHTAGGFFQEVHVKLRPTETVAEGVFLCGLAHGPKSLGETMVQAQAAAARAAAFLFQTELTSGELFAAIDRGKCRRCLSCVGLCPYGAVRLSAAGSPEIQTEVCQGCGICAAACPASAITMSRFTDAEVMAQIRAALEEAPGVR